MISQGVTDDAEGAGQVPAGQDSPPPADPAQAPAGKAVSPHDQDDIQRKINSAVHAALSRAGRTDSQLTAREQSLADKEARLNEGLQKIDQWEQARAQEEAAAVKNSPELLDVVKQKQLIKQQLSELNRERQELAQDREAHAGALREAEEARFEVAVWRVAQRYGLDSAVLKERAQRFRLDSEADIDELARSISPSGMALPGPRLQPDSGGSSGSGIDPNSLSPTAKISYGLRKRRK